MYQKLAEIIRQFGSIDWLAQEIESIEESQGIETVSDLEDFLTTELQYASE